MSLTPENHKNEPNKGLWVYVVVNPFTMIGSFLMAVSCATLLMAIGADFISPISNNYALTVLFAFLPAVFMAGFLIHVFGIIRYRRRKNDEVGVITQSLGNILADRRSRKIVVFSFFAITLSLLILSAAGHRALIYSESPQFCGTLCHQVMNPEYTTYLDSPHSRVACVECHIGEGMSWFIRAKIDGIPMIWEALNGNFPRPVPSPVHTLRPSRDTCEKCHWPAKFHGKKLAVFTRYGNDEKNTSYNTVMLQNVGGQNLKTGEYHGIHWHVSSNVDIYYDALDEKREKIGTVTYRSGGNIVREYKMVGEGKKSESQEGDGKKSNESKSESHATDAKDIKMAKLDAKVFENRRMECIDCHNRPSHIFGEKPAISVDKALTSGQIDMSIPFAKKAATEVLQKTDVSRDNAQSTFRVRLKDFYAAQNPKVEISDEQLDKLAEGVAAVYLRNIYPDQNLVWNTHPSHLGHRMGDNDAGGCFRCHDDKHVSDDGKVISQDCDLCHEILAEDASVEKLAEPLRALISTHKSK